MIEAENPVDQEDPFDLQRFLSAQQSVYPHAVEELRSGRKRSHWMWFIFPQFDGLGSSSTSKYYAIKSVEEAKQYLHHPLLGSRLIECAQVLLRLEGWSASEIFGFPDDLKLKSSMTLFSEVSPKDSLFGRVIEKYFHGQGDTRTIELMRLGGAGARRRD